MTFIEGLIVFGCVFMVGYIIGYLVAFWKWADV